jgi:hypothetical protein
MKKIVMFAMVFVMMLVSLSGCFWWGYDEHGGRGYGGGGGHNGGEGRGGGGDHDGGGGHEERR